MPDIELSGGFTWGSIRSGMQQMQSFVNQTTKGVQKDIAGMFSPAGIGGLLSVVFLEQGAQRIVTYAAKVQDLSNRFAVSTTIIQQFGNVAERNGASLDAMAMGFNRLEVARSKALGGNDKLVESFGRLGITADDLRKLSLPELMLKLGSSSMNAADMVAILGRNGTLLRETLRLLAEGTEKLSAAIDPKQIAALKKADDFWKQLGESARIHGAAALTMFADLGIAADEIYKKFSGENLKNLGASFFRALLGPVPGVGPLINRLIPAPDFSKPVRKGTAEGGAAITGADDLSEASSRAAGGGEDAEARKQETLQQQIDKLEEAHFAKSRTDQEELNALVTKSVSLYYAQASTVGDTNKQLEARKAYLENQAEIEKVSAKIGKDQVDYENEIAQKRQDAEESAMRDLSISQEANREFALRLKGEDDAADRAKIAFDYDTKIKEAQDAITAAEKLGDDAAVKTNQALVVQLGLEKQNALAADAKAKAEASAAAAAEDHAQALQLTKSVDRAKDNLAGLQEQRAEQEQIAAGQVDIAENMHEQFEWQAKINEAADIANENWQKMDQAYSEGKTLLGDQYAALAKINEATVKELDLQRQINEQKKQQALNEKAIHEQTENFFKANAAGVRGVGVGGIGTSGANAEDVAAIVRPGDARAAAIAQAQDMMSFITGKPVGFFEQIRRDTILRNFANEQSAAGLKQGQLVPQQELQFWQQQLSGLSAGGQLQQAPSSIAAAPSGQLQTQITLLQQQLQELVALRSDLTSRGTVPTNV